MAKNIEVNLKISADARAAEKAINGLETALSNLYKKQQSSGFSDLGINEAVKSARQLELSLNRALNQTTGKLDIAAFQRSLSQAGTSVGELSAKLAGAGAAGQQAFSALTNAIVQSEIPMKRTSKMVADFTRSIKNVAQYQISAGLYQGVASALSNAVSYAKELNSSLNDIRIVTGQGANEMARFAAQANKSAQQLSTTTNNYAKAALIFYQQGLGDADVKERTDAVIKMANVTKDSMTEVSSYMTAIWNNFDDGSKSLEHYADVMTALGATTASSTAEIAAGLEKFASIGKTIGLSYDYATSALATIVAQTRQSADTVGTGLRTIFSRLQGLSLGETLEDGVDLNKYSKALSTVGVSILDASGEMKSMDAILDSLAGKWETLSQAQKTALAQTVGGVRQYTTLISLMDNWDSMEKNLNTAKNSSGSLDKQASIYAESWEAASARSQAAIEQLYSSLLNDKAFITMVDGFTAVTKAVTSLVNGLGGIPGILGTIGMIASKTFSRQLGGGIANTVKSLTTWGSQFKGQGFGQGLKTFMTGEAKGVRQVEAEQALKASRDGIKARQAFLEQKGRTNTGEYYRLGLDKKALDNKEKFMVQGHKLSEDQQTQAKDYLTLMTEVKDKQQALDEEARQAKAEYEKMAQQQSQDLVNSLGDATQSNEIFAALGLQDKAGGDSKGKFQHIARKDYIKSLSGQMQKARREEVIAENLSEGLNEDNLAGRIKEANEQLGAGLAEDADLNTVMTKLEEIRAAAAQTQNEIEAVVDSATDNAEKSGNESAKKVAEQLSKSVEDAQDRGEREGTESKGRTTLQEEADDLQGKFDKLFGEVDLGDKIGKGIESATTALSGLTAGMAQAQNAIETFGDAGASAGDKVAAGIGVATGAISAFASGGVLGLAAYAVGALASAAQAVADNVNLKEEREADDAEEAANKLQENYQNIRAEYENTMNTIASYEEATDTLESLVIGTDEWKKALIEANEAALELIDSFDLIQGEDYTIDSNGQIVMTKAGQKKIDDGQSQQLNEMMTAQSTAQLAQAQAAQKRAEAEKDKAVRENNGVNLSVGATTMAAAAAGAAIGSIIPGLGTVIGAVGGLLIGGIVGLVASATENAIDHFNDESEKLQVDKITKQYEEAAGSMTDKELQKLIEDTFPTASDDYRSSIFNVVKSTVEANQQLAHAQKQAAMNMLAANDIYNDIKNETVKAQVANRISENYDDVYNSKKTQYETDLKNQTLREQYVDEYLASLNLKGVRRESTNEDGSFTYSYIGSDGKRVEKAEGLGEELAAYIITKMTEESLDPQVKKIAQTYAELESGKSETYDKDRRGADFLRGLADFSAGTLSDSTGTELMAIAQMGEQTFKDYLSGLSEVELQNLGFDNLTEALDEATKLFSNTGAFAAYADATRNLRDVFSSDFIESNMTTNVAKSFSNMVEELEQGPLSKIGKAFGVTLEDAFKKLNVSDEDRSTLLAQISNIDWSQWDAFDQMSQMFEDLGYSLDDTGQAWEHFETVMRQAGGAIPDFSSLKDNLIEISSILGDLELGSTIGEEEYQALIAYEETWSDLFILQADGSRKFIGNAEDMAAATRQMIDQESQLLEVYQNAANDKDVNAIIWGGETEETVEAFEDAGFLGKDANGKDIITNDALKALLEKGGYTAKRVAEIIRTGTEEEQQKLFSYISKSIDAGEIQTAQVELEEMLASTATTFEELNGLLDSGKISDETYSKSLIAMASGYEYCTEAIKEYQKALASGEGIDEARANLEATIAAEEKAAKIDTAFSNAISGKNSMSVEDLTALKDNNPTLFNQYLTSSDQEWYEASYQAYMKYLDARIASYPKDSAAYAALIQEKQQLEENYYNQVEERAIQAAETIAEAWEQTHTEIENALSLLSNISLDNPFSSLSYVEIEEIRQALLEAGYTAEEVDRKIKNIGKAESENDVAALWEAQRLKTDLYLANIATYEQEADEYQGLLGTEQNEVRIPTVTTPRIDGFQGGVVNSGGQAEVPAELKLNSNVTISGLKDLGNGTYAVYYQTPDGTEKTLTLGSSITVTGIKDNGNGSYSYTFMGPDKVEKTISVSGGVTIDGVKSDGNGGYSYTFTGPDGVTKTVSATGGVSITGTAYDATSGAYTYSFVGPDGIERKVSANGSVSMVGTAYDATTGEYSYDFVGPDGVKRKVSAKGNVTITGASYNASTGAYTYSFVGPDNMTRTYTATGTVTMTGVAYNAETGQYTYSLVDASTGEVSNVTVASSVNITGTKFDATTGTYTYSLVDASDAASKTDISVGGGVTLSGAIYNAETGKWSYSFEGTTVNNPSAITVGGKVSITGAYETSDGHWAFDFQAVNEDGELEAYSFTATGSMELTGADYEDGVWKLHTASGDITFNPSLVSTKAVRGWKDNGDGTYSYIGASGTVLFTASLQDMSALDALPSDNEVRTIKYVAESATAADMEKQVTAKKSVKTGLNGTIWNSFQDQTGWNAFWHGGDADFKKNLESLDGDVTAYLLRYGANGKIAVQKAMSALSEELQRQITNIYGGDVEAAMKNESFKQGFNLLEGLILGYESHYGSAAAYLTSASESLLMAIQIGLQEHSPSKATMEMGAYLMIGLQQGFDKTTFSADSLQGKVLNAIQDQIEQIRESASEEMTDLFALEQYVFGSDKIVNDTNKYRGEEGAYYAANRSAEDTTTYTTAEEAITHYNFNQTGFKMSQNANGSWQILGDDGKTSMSDEVFATESEAMIKAYAIWLAQQASNKGLKEALNNPHTVQSMSAVQGKILTDAMTTAFSKLDKETIEKYGNVETFLRDAGPEEIAKFYSDYVLPEIENASNAVGSKIITNYAQLKDDWVSILEAAANIEKNKAKEIYETWSNTFDAIVAARKAAFSDKSYAEALSDEEFGWLALNKVKKEDGTYDFTDYNSFMYDRSTNRTLPSIGAPTTRKIDTDAIDAYVVDKDGNLVTGYFDRNATVTDIYNRRNARMRREFEAGFEYSSGQLDSIYGYAALLSNHLSYQNPEDAFQQWYATQDRSQHSDWTEQDWRDSYSLAVATANVLPQMLQDKSDLFTAADATVANDALFGADGKTKVGVQSLGNGYYLTADGTFYHQTQAEDGTVSYTSAAMWKTMDKVSDKITKAAESVEVGKTFEVDGQLYRRDANNGVSYLSSDFGENFGEELVDKLMAQNALNPAEQIAYADSVLRAAMVDDRNYLQSLMDVQQAQIDAATSRYESQNTALDQAIRATRGEEDVSVENAAILDEIFGGSSWRTMSAEQLAAKNVELANTTDSAVDALNLFIAALQAGATFVGLDANGNMLFSKDGKQGTAEQLGITLPNSQKSRYGDQAEFDERLDAAQQAGFATLQDQDSFMKYLAEQSRLAEFTEEDIQEEDLRERANQLMEIEQAWKDLFETQSNNIAIIEKGRKGTAEYQQALASLTKTVKKVFGGAAAVTEDFVEEHLADIEKMAQGDEDAIERVEDALLTKILGQNYNVVIDVDIDQDGVKDRVGDIIDSFNDLEMSINGVVQSLGDVQEGTVITPEIDTTGATDALIGLLNQGGDTAAGITEALNAIGWTPEIDYDEVDVTSTTDAGGQVTYTYTDPSTGITHTGGILPEGSIVSGNKLLIPKIGKNGATQYKGLRKTGAGTSFTGDKSGGGGGGARRRYLAKAKPEDHKERYHEVNAAIDDVSDALERLNKQQDRAWGAARIKAMQQETEILKQQTELYRRKAKEAEGYLNGYYDSNGQWVKGDRQLAEEAGWTFDEDGRVNNYEERLDDIINEYNAKIVEYNAMSAQEQETLEKLITEANERFEKGDKDAEQYLNPETGVAFGSYEEYLKYTFFDAPQKYLEQYEGTMEEWEDIQKSILDNLYAEYDNYLEQIKATAENMLEYIDAQIEYIEHKLSRIEDNAYKTAESIDLIVSQIAASEAKLGVAEGELAALLKGHNINVEDFLAGRVSEEDLKNANFTKEEITMLQDIISTAQTAEKEMSEGMVKGIESLTSAFDSFNADLDRYTTSIEHAQSITSTYRNIIDLTGKSLSGFSVELLKAFNDSTIEQAKANMAASKTKYDAVQVQYEKALGIWELAQAQYIAGTLEDSAYLEAKKTFEATEDSLREAQESYMASWEAAIQAVADAYRSTMEAVIEDVSKKLANGLTGGLDALQEYMDRAKTADSNYVDDYEKIYQLTKLTRDLNSQIDNTQNVKTQKELLKFQKEINDILQSDQKLSEYDIDYLQKKYDLKLAEIALEDAQNAKSQVMMRRDSEGNYNYVYTADENAVAEAEAEYEGKLYEMQKANDEYITSLSDNILSLQQDMLSAIGALDPAQFASEEDYNNRVADIIAFYTEQMEVQSSEMGKVLANNKSLYDNDMKWYEEYRNYKMADAATFLDSWDKILLSQQSGFTTQEAFFNNFKQNASNLASESISAYAKWAEEIGKINATAGTSTGGLGEDIGKKVQDLTEQAKKASEEMEKHAKKINDSVDGISQHVSNMLTTFEGKVGAAADKVDTLTLSILALFKTIGVEGFDGIDIDGKLAELGIKINQTQNAKPTDGPDTGYDTGGYTGSWGTEGRLAFLHQKELVLNASDTANMLASVGILRQIASVIDLNALASAGGFAQLISAGVGNSRETLQQEVHIEAHFPNATDKDQIEDAFKDIVNLAAQYANRNTF